MLSKTNYTVSLDILQEAQALANPDDFKTTLNKPTGNFFYDPWVIRDEYKGTVWEKLIDTICEPVGEARLISLAPKMSYHAHADIDDRFHLNLKSELCYLIDLTNSVIHELKPDGVWYDMDAGRIHTASNFGRDYRLQLVVRKCLVPATLKDPVHVKIFSNIAHLDDSRFLFDNKISPWLNAKNKELSLTNFQHTPTCVEFDVERNSILELQNVCGNDFRIEQ